MITDPKELERIVGTHNVLIHGNFVSVDGGKEAFDVVYYETDFKVYYYVSAYFRKEGYRHHDDVTSFGRPDGVSSAEFEELYTLSDEFAFDDREEFLRFMTRILDRAFPATRVVSERFQRNHEEFRASIS